jgi:adenylate kinase
MARPQITFVGGTSGTGKTSLLAAIARRHPHISHLVASRLLGAASSSISEQERLVVHTTEHASALQSAIVDRLAETAPQCHGSSILLDGHYVVPTLGGPFCIPPDIFSAMNVGAFVLLEGNPEVVAARLRLRGVVPWWDGKLESLRAASLLEQRHAQHVAQSLHTSLIRIAADDPSTEAVLLEAARRLNV